MNKAAMENWTNELFVRGWMTNQDNVVVADDVDGDWRRALWVDIRDAAWFVGRLVSISTRSCSGLNLNGKLAEQ